jgi:hypothetical protein
MQSAKPSELPPLGSAKPQ